MIRTWILPGMLLALVLGVVYPDLAILGRVIALGDVPDQFLPWREFVSAEFHQGTIPLWNRFAWCGAPFLANMQSAVLYPVDRLFDLVLSPGHAQSLGLVFHLWLGGMLLFALCRHLGANRTGALVAAIGYSLDGFHAIHLLGGNLLTVTSSIFLPGHLLVASCLIQRVSRSQPTGWVPCCGVLLWSLQILSGHAQMTFYNGVFTLVFLTFGLIFRDTSTSSRTELTGRVVLWFSCMAGITFLLVAPQILPTLEYRGFCARQGTLPLDAATEFSLGWEVLLSFLLPEYLGTRATRFAASGKDTFWGDWKNWSAVYLGIFTIFGLAGLLSPGGRSKVPMGAVKALCGLALVALFLALGRNNPLFHLIHQLPLFGQFRAPSKFIPGLVVPLAVIGSLGLSAILDFLNKPEPSSHLRAWGQWYLIGAGVAGILLISLPAVWVPNIPAELVEHDLLRGLVLVLGFTGLAWLLTIQPFHLKGTKGRHLLGGSLILLCALDMGFYARKYVISAPSEALNYLPEALIQKHLQAGQRVLTTPEFTGVDQSTPKRIPIPGGYDPLQVGLYIDTFRQEGIIAQDAVVDFWTPPLDWAGRLGAALVVSRQLLKHRSLTPLDREEGWLLYRVKDPAPFVEFIPKEPVPDLTTGATLQSDWKEHDLHVRGIVPCEGRIAIRQVYTPGWRCFSKHKERLPIEVEDPFWQKVQVSGGEIDLVLSYQPEAWRWGLRLFPIGLLGLIGMAFLAMKSRKSKLNEMGGITE